MSRRQTLIGLIACGAFVAGCGDGEDASTKSKPAAKPVDVAARSAQLERDPYDLSCADLRDPVAAAQLTRPVQYALADDAKIRDLNRLQASQSIYFAITELCKGEPGSYRPAKDAIAAVRKGELRAEL